MPSTVSFHCRSVARFGKEYRGQRQGKDPKGNTMLTLEHEKQSYQQQVQEGTERFVNLDLTGTSLANKLRRVPLCPGLKCLKRLIGDPSETTFTKLFRDPKFVYCKRGITEIC